MELYNNMKNLYSEAITPYSQFLATGDMRREDKSSIANSVEKE